MGLLDRFRRSRRRRVEDKHVASSAEAALNAFCSRCDGVESWLENPTSFNPPSILLVAGDGEWTRRTIPSVEWGEQWCERRGMTFHQAGLESYPQRMRDWNARQRAAE